MNPRLYLDLADVLVDGVKRSDGLVDAAGRAECRTVISRAYYAAFQVVLELLNFIGIAVTKSGNCHVVSHQGLNNSGDQQLQTVYSHLGTLYSERRAADYDLSNPRAENLQQPAAMAAISRKAIEILDNCLVDYTTHQAQGHTTAGNILAWAKASGKQKEIWKV